MKKKILAIAEALAVLLACILSVPSATSETTVTGTFTPISTGISIACNKTAPGFGNINLGDYGTNVSFNVTNEGDVNCSVTMTAEDGAGNWTLIAGTSAPVGTDKYVVNVNPNATGYVDAYTQQTIVADMPPAGFAWNYTHFDLKVFVSTGTTEETPDPQTFYTNLTAASIS